MGRHPEGPRLSDGRPAAHAGWFGALRAVAARPRLWVTAARQARRMVPQRWWRRPPFVPWPDREYVRFRMVTQYGDPGARPHPADLIAYLEWCHKWQDVGR